MNDEQRAALVHLLQTVMEISYEKGQRRSHYDAADEAKRVADAIEDEFLTDRATTVAEPDAEDAKAMVREVISEAMNKGAAFCQQITSDTYKTYAPYIDRYTDRAIAAMPSGRDADNDPYLGPPDKGVTVKATVVEADDVPMFPDIGIDADSSWLDEALDSVHPVCRIAHMERVSPDEWYVSLQWWDWPTHDRVDPLMRMPWDPQPTGTGTTRREAILDAVQKAKEAQQ